MGKAIEKTEGEIDQVSLRLDALDAEIVAAKEKEDVDEVKELRKKEQQLRKKEEQLRKKEEQLRDKEKS